MYWLHWYYRYCGNKSLNFGGEPCFNAELSMRAFLYDTNWACLLLYRWKMILDEGSFWKAGANYTELYIYAIMVWWSLLKEESPMNGCCYWVETPSSSSWRGSISFQVAFLVATYHQTLLVFEVLSQRLSNFK